MEGGEESRLFRLEEQLRTLLFFLSIQDRSDDFITPATNLTASSESGNITAHSGNSMCAGNNSTDQGQLFIAEQWEAIAGLIGTTKVSNNYLNGKFNTNQWIINTAASYHVIGDKSWLFDISDIYDFPVAHAPTLVRLSENITLKNVCLCSSIELHCQINLFYVCYSGPHEDADWNRSQTRWTPTSDKLIRCNMFRLMEQRRH